jgi:DNA-binding NarL/FixJ family response regulator
MEPSRPDHAIRPLQVLVVDGDRRVRQSLVGLIDLADGMTIAGAAGDADGALQRLAAGHVDVVVLDPRLPTFDEGRTLVGVIRRDWPATCIVALHWPDHPSSTDGTHLTVAPSAVQPDSLVELLRSCAVSHRPDAAAGLS